jgi:hypothetical protein
MPADTPPRSNWRIQRWLFVFIVAALAWSGWRAYTFRIALSQANALGWLVTRLDPAEEIWADWRAAFRKQTWRNEVTRLGIPKGEEFTQRLAIVRRLNPKLLRIYDAPTLRDLSTLNDLPALREVWLSGCTGLTNVEALKNSPALETIRLDGCTGLAKESIAILKVALPKANILTDNK